MERIPESGDGRRYDRRAKMAAIMSGLGLIGGALELSFQALPAAAKTEMTATREAMPAQRYLKGIQIEVKRLSKKVRSSSRAEVEKVSEDTVFYAVKAPNVKNPSHHDELIMTYETKRMDFPGSITVILNTEANPPSSNPVHMKSGENYTFSTENPTTLENDSHFATLLDFWPGGFGAYAVSDGADNFSKKLNSELDTSHRMKYSTQPREVTKHFDSFLGNAERILKHAQ